MIIISFSLSNVSYGYVKETSQRYISFTNQTHVLLTIIKIVHE